MSADQALHSSPVCTLLGSPEGRAGSKEQVAQHDAQRPHVSLHSVVGVGGVEG